MKHVVAKLVVVAALAAPAPVAAQGVEEAGGTILSAGIGTTAGLVGGAYANLAIVVLKARMGHYKHSFEEAFGWESIPILAGGGVGLSIGLWDQDLLWRWVLGGATGWAAGAGAGYVVGSVLWGDSESRWANAAIGAALGMAAGSTAALLLRGGDDDDTAVPSGMDIAVVRLRF